MKPHIGVLLERRALLQSVHGRPGFERLDLYAAAAAALDVDVIFFAPGDVRLKDDRVTGYMPVGHGKYRRTETHLPRAIHQRALPSRKRDRAVIRRLADRGVLVYNPPVNWSKLHIYRLLSKDPGIRPHLPETRRLCPSSYPWFRRQLLRGAELFVKPARGSLGVGIVRLTRKGERRYRYESRRKRADVTLGKAWNLINRGDNRRLLQAGVPLLEDGGRRVDFRVPVQRDEKGEWHTAGIAAKRAERHAYLTNLARGGSVHDARRVLARHFGDGRANRVVDEMCTVAARVAETLAATEPLMADLGLDIGVDRDGRVYVIEVNRRDLRVLLAMSGQHDATAALFRNPIAFGKLVIVQGNP